MFYDQKPTDLEKAVIGCALNDREALAEVIALTTDQMVTPTGAEILTAMQYMADNDMTIDLVTVDAQTKSQYTSFLVDATQAGAISANYAAYIEALKDSAKRRKIIAASHELVNNLSEATVDIDDAVDEFKAKIETLASSNNRTVSALEATMALVNGFDKKDERRALTGVSALDAQLGGLFGGKLIVIGARPGTGKSALALSAAMATQNNGSVLFCSYEMNPDEIMGRALANLSGVNSRNIALKHLSANDYAELGKHYETASRMDIRFTTTARTPATVRTEALKMAKYGNLRLIVIDYLQLMSSGRRAESRRVEVGQISNALKALALEINVPIIALSQLNRQSETKADREPDLSDLRESGDIEQDADIIVLLYQPKDGNDENELNAKGLKTVRMLIGKNRQGQVGQRIDAAFDGQRMKFLRMSEARGQTA